MVCLTTGVVIGFWLFQIPTLGQALTEAHGFRQTQTAYQSLTLSQGFGSLLHPKLPIFGSPWETPFEFPVFQFSAALLIKLFDLTSDMGNRLASLIWFTLCLPALWLIVRKALGVATACAAVLVFTLNPFSLQWSRASLIEYCALFFGLCFVYFFQRNWQESKVHLSVVAILTGSLCGLVKSTTLLAMLVFLIFLLPDLLNTILHVKNNLKRIINSVAVIGSVFLATAWWTHHADQIKQRNPATRWLTSGALQEWSFGSLDQRLNMDNWLGILGRMDSLVLPRFSIMALFLLPLLIQQGRRLALASVASIVLTVNVFFNLYQVHDYYLVALTPQLAILLAIGLRHLVSSLPQSNMRVAAIGVLAIAIILPMHQSKSYWQMSRTSLSYSHELKSLTKPNQFIIYGFNTWDPIGLYYSERRGMMMDSRGMTPELLKDLPDLKSYDFYHGPMERFDLIGIRGWYAPVGSATIRIDDNPEDFGPIGVVFSKLAQHGNATMSKKLDCDGVDAFSFEPFPVNTSFQTVSLGKNFFIKAPGIISIPVGKSAIKVSKPADAPPQTVTCTGGGTVSFLRTN